MTNGVDISVIDIGRINPFSIETAAVKPDKFESAGWKCVSAEEYHRHISRRGTKLSFEEKRRRKMKEYRAALESLATSKKKTCLLNTFVDYCVNLSRHFTIVWQEKRKFFR